MHRARAAFQLTVGRWWRFSNLTNNSQQKRSKIAGDHQSFLNYVGAHY